MQSLNSELIELDMLGHFTCSKYCVTPPHSVFFLHKIGVCISAMVLLLYFIFVSFIASSYIRPILFYLHLFRSSHVCVVHVWRSYGDWLVLQFVPNDLVLCNYLIDNSTLPPYNLLIQLCFVLFILSYFLFYFILFQFLCLTDIYQHRFLAISWRLVFIDEWSRSAQRKQSTCARKTDNTNQLKFESCAPARVRFELTTSVFLASYHSSKTARPPGPPDFLNRNLFDTTLPVILSIFFKCHFTKSELALFLITLWFLNDIKCIYSVFVIDKNSNSIIPIEDKLKLLCLWSFKFNGLEILTFFAFLTICFRYMYLLFRTPKTGIMCTEICSIHLLSRDIVLFDSK